MEYKEKNSKGEQEVRAGWELKEKESRRDKEVRAGNTKRRRVEGNKKSEQQGVKSEEE